MKIKLKPPPRFHLAITPTPLEILSPFPLNSRDVAIFVKRDDLTGSQLSGNKIRKLEYVLNDDVAKKSDTLITCGGRGSNHCRAVAALAARTGLGCELILNGKKPVIPDGNLLLDNLFNARTKFISLSDYENRIDMILKQKAQALTKKGKNAYIIPEGASTPLGVWGYFTAGLELKAQLDKAGIKADYIACAVGSGGTYAGLMAAALYLNWPVKIIGFAVNRNATYFSMKINRLLDDFMALYNLELAFTSENIIINDDYIGPGYAKISDKEARFIKKTAAETGLILDPAYTAKAMFGLFDLIKKGTVEPGSTVVFIHTGGLLSIFPYRKRLSRI